MDLIEELQGKSDTELLQLSGMGEEVQRFRDQLEKVAKLQGKEREKAIEVLEKRMAPRMSPWDVEDALFEASPKKSGKDVLLSSEVEMD